LQVTVPKCKDCKAAKDAGFNVPMFTSDGSWLFEGGSVVGATTANGEDNIENLKSSEPV
jgi:beta-galactosidase